MATDYQVYVLINDAGKKYTGLSEDVPQRLIQHNAGESKWTAKHKPWKLLWTSNPMNLSEARKLENLMKRQKGGQGLGRIMKEQEGS